MVEKEANRVHNRGPGWSSKIYQWNEGLGDNAIGKRTVARLRGYSPIIPPPGHAKFLGPLGSEFREKWVSQAELKESKHDTDLPAGCLVSAPIRHPTIGVFLRSA
jgi:hypothetical protein